ncbi:MAG: hypothetical protein VX317_11085, partial [Verrucomicrobiota bacterium]|nr:hypothetical protein [Verrucomicrobiota bacterium]
TATFMKQVTLLLTVGVFGMAAAHAEIGANETTGEFHLKAGLIHGVGTIAGTGLSADGEGFRVGGGYQLTDLFSVNARYEAADTDIYQDFRLTVDGEMDLTDEVSLHLGAGYGNQNIFDGAVETDGVLANVALCWERGAFIGGVNYMRVFAIETGTNQLDRGVPVDLPEEDFDLLEIVAGYRLNERMAILLSYETQVGGDTQVEKEKQITLELRYKL